MQPDGNAEALVAQGALANARHDFAAARRDALGRDRRQRATTPRRTRCSPTPRPSWQRGGGDRGRAAHARPAARPVRVRPRLLRPRTARPDRRRRATSCAGRWPPPSTATTSRSAGPSSATWRSTPATWPARTPSTPPGSTADPSSAALQRGRARVAAARGRMDEALDRLRRAHRRAPTPSLPARVRRTAARRRPGGRRRRPSSALAAAAHELFTGNGGVDGLTGAALAQATGRPGRRAAEARAEWSRRQHADVADTLAWALHLAGGTREALAYARRALRAPAPGRPVRVPPRDDRAGPRRRRPARDHLAPGARRSTRTSPRSTRRLARRALAGLESMMNGRFGCVAGLVVPRPAGIARRVRPAGRAASAGAAAPAGQLLGQPVPRADPAPRPGRRDGGRRHRRDPDAAGRARVDTDGDGTVSAAERAAHADGGLRATSPAAVDDRVGDDVWTGRCVGRRFTTPGRGGLEVSRLALRAVRAGPPRPAGRRSRVENGYLADRVGWREMTAAGAGVGLVDSPLPARASATSCAPTRRTCSSSPLDVRSAMLRVEPGSTGRAASRRPGDDPAGGDPVSRWMAALDRRFQDAGRRPRSPRRRPARGAARAPARRRPRGAARPRQDGARRLPGRRARPPARRVGSPGR